MDQSVRRFSEQWPRFYGFVALVLAIILGFLGWHFVVPGIPFIWILLLTGFGIMGALYLSFGFSAHRWFMMRPIRDRLSWKQICLDVSLGLLIYVSARLLDSLLNR